MVPLGTRTISETEPLVVTFRPAECYYWFNDRNKLCLAMRYRNPSILGRWLEEETVLSLVLDDPPAASSRDYPVGAQTFRMRRRAGLSHIRSVSLTGVVGVWDYGKANLRGRFRLTVKQQSYSVLTGWTGNARAVIVGAFTARPNAKAGKAINVRTEEGALRRPPLPNKPQASARAD